MKKQNNFRKIITKSLLGFPIGISLLMISYASLYFIAGEDVFKTEIMQLQNIHTLIFQLITIGVIYLLFFIIISLFAFLNENKITSDKYAAEHPFKTLLIILLGYLIIVLICALIGSKVFTKNIGTMNMISFAIISLFCGIYSSIKSIIESDIVKQINQKLKERNAKNTN